MNYLIGISGKAGHGKDSLAYFLKELFYHNMKNVYTRRIGFADKLKEVTANLLYTDIWNVSDQAGKQMSISHMGDITGRKALQIIGTDIARNIYPDIWVFHYRLRVRDFFCEAKIDTNHIVFTSDVRFKNEYECVYNFEEDNIINVKPILIRVWRPGFDIGHGSEHESETALDHIDDWDYKVVAENLTELKKQAEEVYKSIVK